MANLALETEEVVEGRVMHVAECPISFERFLDLAPGRWVELIDGVVVEKPMVQLDHELCTRWLYAILIDYTEERVLGRALSSRIMVKADNFGGRMPDLLFVRQDNLQIVQQKAVFGAPDLVVEVVSPNDRPSDLRALEADYYRLGVQELIFIDLQKGQIKQLARGEQEYRRTTITTGPITFATVAGLTLQAEWLLREPRPGIRTTLNALLSA
jgi:Uma2 family endonuclease